MGIKTAILSMAMGLGGLSASAEPAWSPLPGGDDPSTSAEPPSAVVVCPEADPFSILRRSSPTGGSFLLSTTVPRARWNAVQTVTGAVAPPICAASSVSRPIAIRETSVRSV